ncbi:MAG: hypothetical protein CL566_00710 [Alphaproteobacteria bacterium]|nr:hypothetical protein [Alphaproteobacteria bacterium]
MNRTRHAAGSGCEVSMARKTNYNFEKRQREIKKKEKKAAKAEAKRQQAEARKAGLTEDGEMSGTDTDQV